MQTMWSPNCYTGRVRPVLHIVIHTMEAAKQPDTAERVAAYFQRPETKASAHYCIDNNSIVQGVRLSDTAWACPGFNASGVQFEHAGYAAQSSAGWSDDYARAMLHRSARKAANVADDYSIPVRRLTTAQLRNGNTAGFLGHGDATAAGIAGNTHTDPGAAFPWTGYLDLVTAYRSGVTPTPPKPEPTQADWVAGPKVVSAWQRYEHTTADGIISRQPSGNRACMPADHWTTVEWVAPAAAGAGSPLIRAAQKRVGVEADGFAGPNTWKALQRWLDVTPDGIAGNHTIEALARKVHAV